MQDSVTAALAALQPEVETPAPLQFALNFLWLEKNVAIAVDQLFDQVMSICLEPAQLSCGPSYGGSSCTYILSHEIYSSNGSTIMPALW